MSSTGPTRRTFLRALVGIGAAGLCGAGLRRTVSSPLAVNRLRPPGAVPEEDFLGGCIRCGRCVEVCPWRSIDLADLADGIAAGTPVVDAVHTPCYLCMLCVDVCPSGALRPIAMEETRMGLAVIDREACVAWSGESLCRTCYNVCPLQDVAIELPMLRPEVTDRCTGCGLCVHGCPISTGPGRKAVNVDPGGHGGAAG